MNSFFKKILVIGVLTALVGTGYFIDTKIAETYSIEVVSAKRSGEENALDSDNNVIPLDCGITDGETKVTFDISLTKNDKPVFGHTLYVITNKNVIGRFKTDDNGHALVEYRCYRTTTKSAVKDVVVTIKDENNSLFVSVPCKTTYTLEMRMPKQEGEVVLTDDYFFDV